MNFDTDPDLVPDLGCGSGFGVRLPPFYYFFVFFLYGFGSRGMMRIPDPDSGSGFRIRSTGLWVVQFVYSKGGGGNLAGCRNIGGEGGGHGSVQLMMGGFGFRLQPAD